MPLNYRLADPQLRAAVERIAPALSWSPRRSRPRASPASTGSSVVSPDALGTIEPSGAEPEEHEPDPDAIAILLFTSGTSGEPKGAVLRPSHLVSYVLSTVEFLGADEDEAILVSVPPYHIAGISSVLTSVYARPPHGAAAGVQPSRLGASRPVRGDHARHGRPDHARAGSSTWSRPTASGLPSLRHLSYGGGRMPGTVVERALHLLPQVDLVNAYGLTETSSTIAVLGPRGAPRGRRERGPGGAPTAGLGRSAASLGRDRDP